MFDPEPWQERIMQWDKKMFIVEKVKTLWFMPLNFGGAMKRVMNRLEAAGAQSPDWMGLSDHTSKWNMDILVAVDRDVPGPSRILSGTYLSMVYEGKFSDTGKWCSDFTKKAAGKGYETVKWYMWYTTCPKCARVYGKNYVVIICEVKQK